MKQLTAVVAAVGAVVVFYAPSSLTQQTPHHEFTVIARRYAYEPATPEVHQGDLVRVTLQTQDIPHSLVIDALRIAKRAAPDHPVTFEMFAERAGIFPFYCNLTLEDGCRQMRGQLVVHPEKTGNQPTSGHGRRKIPPAVEILRRASEHVLDAHVR